MSLREHFGFYANEEEWKNDHPPMIILVSSSIQGDPEGTPGASVTRDDRGNKADIDPENWGLPTSPGGM